MYKFIFSFLFSCCFSFSALSALSLMDIADSEKDSKIERKHLPRYIKTIFDSRAEYLKERIAHCDSENDGLLELGKTSLEIPLVLNESSQSQETDTYRNTYRLTYQDQLKFVEDDPFTFPTSQGSFIKLDLRDNNHLIIFYQGMAHTLLTAYERSRAGKEDLRTKSKFNQLVMEPLLLDEESMIEDLATIIRAVRPHLSTDNLTSLPIKELLEEGNKKLEWLGILDTAYQWRDLSLNPEFQKILREHFSKERIPLKPTQHELKEEKETLFPPIDPLTSPISPSKEEMGPKSELPREEEETSPKAKEKEKKPRVKAKTQPSPEKKDLNDLFDKELAWKKAKRKLEENNKSISKELDNTSPSSESLPSKELTESRLKILQKLLYGSPHSINVSKALGLLDYLGFVQSTSSQHLQLKTKPTEIWLDGKRIVIDATPIQTLAIAHKSGGKKYFKPYVVQRLRDALIEAGFDKILAEE